MKTVFKIINNQLNSELRIHDKHNTMLKILPFNLRSINNWYPLNTEYELLYKVEDNCIQLVPVSRKEIVYADYGIEDINNKLEYSVKDGLTNTIIKQVQLDNNKICRVATSMNIPNWLDDYTYKDVNNSIKQITDELNILTITMIKTYYYDLSQDEQSRYMSLSKPNKERLALSSLSRSESEQYINYGKIYAMLNIMRKVAKLYA